MDRNFVRAETHVSLVPHLGTRTFFLQAAEFELLNVEWRHFLAFILLRFASSYSKLFLVFATATEIKMLFLPDQSAAIMLVVQTLVCLLTDFSTFCSEVIL